MHCLNSISPAAAAATAHQYLQLALLLRKCCSASTVRVDVSVAYLRLQPPVDHAGHLAGVLWSWQRVCDQLIGQKAAHQAAAVFAAAVGLTRQISGPTASRQAVRWSELDSSIVNRYAGSITLK